MKIKRFRGLVAALLAVTAVVIPGATSASAATELTFWSWRTEDKAFYENQIKLFQAKNPDITVKFTPYLNTEYNAILSTALTAGKGPDIIQMRPYGGMANLSDAGNFLPLTAADVPALKKLPAGILAAAQGYKDKKQYGLPYAVSALGIMYNPDILDQAGVRALPQTWAQLMEAFDKVKKAGFLPIGNAGNTMRGLFANEKAAFYIGGNYEIGYFRSLNPSLNIGWFPAPKANAGAKRYVGTWADGSYAINAKTANKAAALKFLNFLGTKEFGQALVDEIAFIPTAPYVKINDPAVKEINRWRTTLGTPFLNVVGFRYESPTSSSILQPGFQKLIVGGTTPEQLAKDVQTAVASWYAPQKGKS
ncbi:MAG: extracellular solute-binding protein [Actinobacteria bacterium]|nr:extracellular solute-binding protein [Actinomycetota bacterium]